MSNDLVSITGGPMSNDLSSVAGEPIGNDLFPVAEDDLERLRTALADRAAAERLLDVAYRVLDSPIGSLLVAVTPKGLTRVAFEREGFDEVLGTLAERISPRVLEAPARLDGIATQLEQYFQGERKTFDLPLDYSLSSRFRALVQRYLPAIAYGQTRSYKEVAEAVGNPKAVRAVGSACATNPLPVVVPCHRVLRTDGTLGGYAGGLEVKTRLLDLESSG